MGLEFFKFKPEKEKVIITIFYEAFNFPQDLPKHWLLPPISTKKGFQCYIDDGKVNLKTINLRPIREIYYLDILLNEYHQSTLYQEI